MVGVKEGKQKLEKKHEPRKSFNHIVHFSNTMWLKGNPRLLRAILPRSWEIKKQFAKILLNVFWICNCLRTLPAAWETVKSPHLMEIGDWEKLGQLGRKKFLWTQQNWLFTCLLNRVLPSCSFKLSDNLICESLCSFVLATPFFTALSLVAVGF